MFELACHKEYSAAGLILQSPFLSIFRTLYNYKKTKYFDLFNNCDKAKHLCRKTLFIHGNKDNIIPYVHGRILAKLIPQEHFYYFLTVNNASHNNIFKINKDLIYKTIRQFIKDCTGQSSDLLKNIEIKEKPPALENIEINSIKEKGEKDIVESSFNKLNKSDEIKSPYNNLISNNNTNLNLNSSWSNQLNMMYNNNTFNNNIFKSESPNNINNIYNLQNKNIVSPFSSIYKSNINQEINNIYNINKSNQVIINNNRIFNSNYVQDNLKANIYNSNNSTLNNFNNS